MWVCRGGMGGEHEMDMRYMDMGDGEWGMGDTVTMALQVIHRHV